MIVFGNIAIAGHNYNNDKFFSNINLLEQGDLIYLKDLNNVPYTYIVFDKYETDSFDISCLNSTYNNSKELTLVTCNNSNQKRIIIKCVQIS